MNEFDKSWCSVVSRSVYGTVCCDLGDCFYTVLILNIGVSGFGSRYSFVCMLGLYNRVVPVCVCWCMLVIDSGPHIYCVEDALHIVIVP